MKLHPLSSVADVHSCSPADSCCTTAGDGYSGCKATSQIESLASAYYTRGSNQLACDEGQNVTYPTTAPGYTLDPSGHYQQAQVSASLPFQAT